MVGKDTVYSELKAQSSMAAETGVSVQSADGFVVEQYYPVRTDFSVGVSCCVLINVMRSRKTRLKKLKTQNGLPVITTCYKVFHP